MLLGYQISGRVHTFIADCRLLEVTTESILSRSGQDDPRWFVALLLLVLLLWVPCPLSLLLAYVLSLPFHMGIHSSNTSWTSSASSTRTRLRLCRSISFIYRPPISTSSPESCI